MARFSFYDELKRSNCFIEKFNVNDFSSVEEANEKLLNQIKQKKYDLFISYFNENHLYIDTLEQIKKIGIPTLLICYDNLLIPFFHKKNCKALRFSMAYFYGNKASL